MSSRIWLVIPGSLLYRVPLYRGSTVFKDGLGNYWGRVMFDIQGVRCFDHACQKILVHMTNRINSLETKRHCLIYTRKGKLVYNIKLPLTENLKLSFILMAFVSGIFTCFYKRPFKGPLKSYIICKQLKNQFTLRMIRFLLRKLWKAFKFAKSCISDFKSMAIYSFECFSKQIIDLNDKISEQIK